MQISIAFLKQMVTLVAFDVECYFSDVCNFFILRKYEPFFKQNPRFNPGAKVFIKKTFTTSLSDKHNLIWVHWFLQFP